MAIRSVKCSNAECKKDIPKDEAYKVVTISKAGKATNTYYCSKEEYEERESQLKYMQHFKDVVVCDLLGHGREEKVYFVLLNKQIASFRDNGYTYSKMYYCILNSRDFILTKIESLKTEVSKITYAMAIVKSNLEDDAHMKKVDEIFNFDLELFNKLQTEDYKIVNDSRNILDFLD